MQEKIIVLKFGSSVLRHVGDIPTACHEIYRWYRDGYRVIAVVSALGDCTEELLARARELSSSPEGFATAELLATGERQSAALMGIALDRIGVRTRVLDPSVISLRTVGTALDGDPTSIDRDSVIKLFSEYDVLVLPGFFGHDADQRVSLLGRGGSDLSAVFLAGALDDAPCRLLKDVDGVYESDPADDAVESPAPHRFDHLSYDDALRVARPLIQPKAVEFAARRGLTVDIAALGQRHRTRINAGERAIGAPISSTPTRVVLLGLGTVGGGVLTHLRAMPAQFEVVGVVVRDATPSRAIAVSPARLITDPTAIHDLDFDVLVDTLSDAEQSTACIVHALSRGINVVTASKRAVNESQSRFREASRASGATLLYTAAVGGGTPMIEAVDRIRALEPIDSIDGVLNGTCNFLLHQLDQHRDWDDALSLAQSFGFAEADPSEDLSGRDIERKLRILAEHAFSKGLHIDEWETLDPDRVLTLRREHPTSPCIRMIASARRVGERVHGSIRLKAFDARDGFAALREEWNGLRITTASGRTHWVSGRGAGRWPTSEAVVADLWTLRRSNGAESRATGPASMNHSPRRSASRA